MPTYPPPYQNVYYYTEGTAPDRKLVVYWLDCRLYACSSNAAIQGTFQIVLYEQGSVIYNNIQDKPACNNYNATQGVQNIDGTIAFTATGRNNTQWTAQNESTHFVPSGITWYANAYPGGTIAGYGADIHATPPVTTTYYCVVASCSSTPSIDSVTVIVQPHPTISGASTVCYDETQTYSTEAGMTNYTWVANGGVITAGGNGADTARVHWNVLAGTHTISVNYNDPVSGCVGITPTIYTVTVNPPPVPSITGIGTVCAGTNGLVYFTESLKTGYTWSISPGGIITAGSTTESITVNWNTAGTQSLTVNYSDVNGCRATPPALMPVTVNPMPLPTITGPATVCIGSAGVTYFTEPSMTSYIWTISPGGLITSGSTTNTITVNWNSSGAQTLTVNYIDANGCAALSASPMIVNVQALPVPTITGPLTTCAGSSGVTYTTEQSMSTYKWTISPGGSIISGSSTNTITVNWNSAGIQTITVNYNDANGCTATTATSQSVTVNSLPVPTITGPSSVCAGSVGVSYATEPSMTGYSWTISPGGTISSGSTSNTISTNWNTVGTQNVTVSYTDANGCTAASPTPKSITVNSLPLPTITGPDPVCAGSVGLSYSTEPSMTGYAWTISPGGIINSGSSTNTVNVNWNTAGIQNLNINYTDANGCTAASATQKSVNVTPLPTATISGTIAVCQNAAPPQITFAGASATAPYTFSYQINGGLPQFVTTTSGNSVTVDVPTTTVGTFTYTLLGVQDGSTLACSQAQGGTAVVTVNPLATANISGTTAVCLNAASPQITFTGGNATPPYTFTYTVNGGANQYITTTSGNTVSLSAPTNVVGTLTYTLLSVQDGSPTSCSQVQSGTALVTVNPLPTASVAGATSVCRNAASPLVTFTGANATAPYTFTYQINGGTNLVVSTSSGNSVSVAAPTGVAGPFIYSLVSVQEGSSTACSQAQSSSTTITINPLPTATISGTTAVCQNSASPPITFTGASSTAPYTFTYTVNGGAPQTVTTTAGNSVTVPAPTNVVGTVSYDLVSVQDGSTTSCLQAQSGNATITVNPSPTALISGTTAVCLNAASPLVTFTGGNATAPYTFTYNINGGAPHLITTSSGNSVTLAVPTNVVGTFAYNLTGVQDGSGTSCAATQMGNATITVNALPTASISGSTAVCQNAAPPSITFTGASTTTPYTFTYTINGGANQFVTTSSGSSVTVAAPTAVVGTFTYTLVSVQDGSSTACSQAQGGTAVVTVNPLPTATITGSTAVCQNAAAPSITLTGASSTAPYTFTYTINAGAPQTITTTSGSSVSITVPTATVGTFTYALVSVHDGTTLACSQAQSGSATVTVNPLPTATIAGTTAVCLNAASPMVTFNGAAASAPYTFTYKINGGVNQFVTTSSGSSVSVPAPTNVVGTYTYTLVSVQDGSSTACSQAQSGSAAVTVNPLPFVSLTACNDPKTTTTSRSFTLKGGVPPGGQYYIDGVAAGAGLFNPSALSTTTHLVTYAYTDFNTCTSTAPAVPITVISGSASGTCPQTFTDPRDNASYKAFILGSHCWMLTNLNYGTKMASALQPQSDNCSPEKYCLSTDATCSTYGGLYQWDELMQYQVPAAGLTVQGLCPPEWHVPTQAEWTDLVNAVASTTPGDALAGSFLKDANPTFGFHALLDGIFYLNDTWAFISGSLTASMYWTATTNGPVRAVARGMNNFTYSVSFYPSLKPNAFPVRCVKD